jgi:flagellar basal-body rod protein FlgF
MDVGLYIAAQGMLAEQARQDALANDLANSSTPGYKPETLVQESFGAMLLSNAQNGQAVGTIESGVKIGQESVDMTPAALEPTGNVLDFAIVGPGFFAVRTAQGVQYTRNGQFSESSKGILVDQNGDPVLTQNGAQIQVGSSGTVPTSALGVFNVPKPTEIGNNNFTGATAGRVAGATVESGQLEGSGVDPIYAVVDMNDALESYQAGQKAIQTIQQTLQESAGSVGGLGGI